MKTPSGLIFLLGQEESSLQGLSQSLQALGCEVSTVQNIEAIRSQCIDPLVQPVIISAGQTSIDSSAERAHIAALAKEFLIVVALAPGDNQCVAEYFRLGVADVVFPETSDAELAAILKRVGILAESRL